MVSTLENGSNNGFNIGKIVSTMVLPSAGLKICTMVSPNLKNTTVNPLPLYKTHKQRTSKTIGFSKKRNCQPATFVQK